MADQRDHQLESHVDASQNVNTQKSLNTSSATAFVTNSNDDELMAMLYLTTRVHFTLMSYWEPTFAISCIAANILILAFFSPKRAVRAVSRNVRFYYLLMGFFDLIGIITARIIVSFVGYGITYITDGWINLNILVELDVTCKTLFTVFILMEQLSAFTLLLFSVERLVVVYFPLRAKTLLSYRRTQITTAAVLGVVVLLSLHLPVSIHSVEFRLSTYCTVDPIRTPPALSALFWMAMGLESFAFPTAVICVLNTFILRRILSASSKRQQMGTNALSADASLGNSSSSRVVPDSSRERRATLSLVFVSSFHIVMNIPAALIYGYLALHYLGLFEIDSEVKNETLEEVAWVAFHITSLSKVVDFLVFYFKIPYFKQEVNRFFSCCCPSNSSSSFATRQSETTSSEF